MIPKHDIWLKNRFHIFVTINIVSLTLVQHTSQAMVMVRLVLIILQNKWHCRSCHSSIHSSNSTSSHSIQTSLCELQQGTMLLVLIYKIPLKGERNKLYVSVYERERERLT